MTENFSNKRQMAKHGGVGARQQPWQQKKGMMAEEDFAV